MNPLIDSSAAFGLSFFGWSIVLGAALGVVYTAFSLLSMVCGLRTVGRFVLDLLFFGISALSVFLFVIARNAGMVRGYALLGTAVGFAFYHLTLGRLLSRFFGRIDETVRRAEEKCRRKLSGKMEKSRTWLKKHVKLPSKKQKQEKKHLPDPEIP